jgi:hypothetical protein
MCLVARNVAFRSGVSVGHVAAIHTWLKLTGDEGQVTSPAAVKADNFSPSGMHARNAVAVDDTRSLLLQSGFDTRLLVE